jgi:hypothetical protein
MGSNKITIHKYVYIIKFKRLEGGNRNFEKKRRSIRKKSDLDLRI